MNLWLSCPVESCILKASVCFLSAMLHVWRVSGEKWATIPAESSESENVKMLKQHLHGVCGVPRFRQRLLHEGRALGDDETLNLPNDVLLVLLPFCECAESRDELARAADSPLRRDVVEEILQRPLDPNLQDSSGRVPLVEAARKGHVEIARLSVVQLASLVLLSVA